MQGIPKALWDQPPWNRWSFQHVRDILPTVEVRRGAGSVRHLPRDEQPLDDLVVGGVDGTPTTLAEFLEQTFTDGVLVLHHGAIAHERYLNGMDERTLHLSQSLAKSFTGALAGVLAARGVIHVDSAVDQIVPELATTAYHGAKIRHLLDMTSGVAFSEDYTDPLSGMGKADVASGWKPIPVGLGPGIAWPATMLELILSLREREAAHGARFAYRSIETDALALVLERATGTPFHGLLSAELWQSWAWSRAPA